jgi:dTDP-4-dehydrorhamnose 3,5-epimerase
MNFTETRLNGAFIIDVERREDERGFFGRAWCQHELEALGLSAKVVQANVSYNRIRGTLRGMHYQVAPFLESKVIRCTSGSIFDVIIDLRSSSRTYGHWTGVQLTAESLRMLYVPEGFAHGFLTLEDHTSVHYMVTEFYTPDSEAGIRFDDPEINIEWPFAPVLVSEKDKKHPPFIAAPLMREAARQP